MDILYIHGMGGGADSRIPSILKERLVVLAPALRVTVRTYDFAPDIACGQIAAWVEELKPGLVIGESMGAIHALAVSGVCPRCDRSSRSGPTPDAGSRA